MDQTLAPEENKQASEKPKAKNKLLISLVIVLLLPFIVFSFFAMTGLEFGAYKLVYMDKSTDGEASETYDDKIKDDYINFSINHVVDKYLVGINNPLAPTRRIVLDEGSLTDEYKAYITLRQMLPDHARVSETGNPESSGIFMYDYNEANRHYHSLFGNEDNLSQEKYFWCGFRYDYGYDATAQQQNCGGIADGSIKYIIKEYSFEDEKLSIKVYFASIARHNDVNQISVLLNDETEYVLEEIDSDDIISVEYYNKFEIQDFPDELKEKLPICEFIFEKDDGNFVLSDINKLS